MLRYWPILAVMTVGCGRFGIDDRIEASATLDVDFTRGQIGSLQFRRATFATYFDAGGILRLAGPDVPRFDHDPITRAPRGLLIESSRTNLLVRSATLDDDAEWFTDGGAIVQANQAIAPDGTLSAERVIDQNAGGQTRCAQAVYTGRRPLAFSIYARAGTTSTFTLGAELIGGAPEVLVGLTVDLIAGTIDSPRPAGLATASGIEPLPDGWYRVWMAIPINGALNTLAVLSVWGNREDLPNTGSIYAWGGQIEEGVYPTSYIETTSLKVIRSADVVTEGDLSWLVPDLGTLRVRATVEHDVAQVLPAVCLLPANAGEGLCLRRNPNAAHELAISTQSATGATWPPRSSSSFAVAWDREGSVLWDVPSGVLPGLPPFSQTGRARVVALAVGTDYSRFLDGHLERVTYWPRRLSEDELPLLAP